MHSLLLEVGISLSKLSGSRHMESTPEHKWKRLVDRLLSRRVVSQEPVVSQTCNHPPESVVNGANQYGSWQRCLLCQTKISYVPHRAKPPAKAGKKAVAYTSQPPAVALERRASSSSKERGAEIVESLGKVMAESTHQLQVAMAQCNQQVLAGMAQSNQQVMNGMGTMIQTMQSMQATQQGMMQEVRGLAAMGIMGAGRTELPDAAMQPPSVHGVAPAQTAA